MDTYNFVVNPSERIEDRARLIHFKKLAGQFPELTYVPTTLQMMKLKGISVATAIIANRKIPVSHLKASGPSANT